MNLFIIGDVHGCWYSYQELLKYWNPEQEILIQLGDLIDRGNYSPQCLKLSWDLQADFPENTVFLRGNHEQLMINYLSGNDPSKSWIFNGGGETLAQFEHEGKDPSDWLNWLRQLPLMWENKDVFVSHAGISDTPHPFDENNPNGILWNRLPLRDIGKMQIIGHTPQIKGRASYCPRPPSWNIDTGAFRGIAITGLKLEKNGHFLEEINIPTDKEDVDL